MATTVKISRKFVENCLNDNPQFLIGIHDATSIYILAAAEVPDKPEERLNSIQKFLPGGLSVKGIAVGTKSSPDKYVDMLKSYSDDKPLVIQKGTGPDKIETVSMATDDGLKTVKWEVDTVPLLTTFALATTKCNIPIAFCLGDKGNWQTALNAEIDRVIHEVTSASTIFHLTESSIMIGSHSWYGLPESATVQSLAEMTAVEEAGSRKKKDKKQYVVWFDVYTDYSSESCLESLPSCAPVINYKTSTEEVVSINLQLNTLSLLPQAQPASQIGSTLATALHRQLLACKQCINQYSNSKSKKFMTPVVFHCQPVTSDALFTVVYPHGILDDQLEEAREQLHQYFCLPTDRPLFRRTNKFTVPDGSSTQGGYLVNVHENVGKSKVSGGHVSCVQGLYTYHHYMQDRFDDNKWGCAYRSLQTLVSWFRLQGYTDVDIPSHPKIQQTLVDIGDKEPKFVGSRQWIGSMEVSFVLDTLLGVTSKIMSVGAGSELAGKGRELSVHFQTEGTPIMIGGGVLAHTILGVDYDEVSGDINFLILDPHYTGTEDIKTIKDKGWCGWKDPEFWDQHARYNLCMPQRPRLI